MAITAMTQLALPGVLVLVSVPSPGAAVADNVGWQRSVLRSRLSSAAKLVALTLSSHVAPAAADDPAVPAGAAVTAPGLPVLVVESGYSRTHVQRQLSRLRHLGWLATVGRPSAGRPARFVLTMPADIARSAGVPLIPAVGTAAAVPSTATATATSTATAARTAAAAPRSRPAAAPAPSVLGLAVDQGAAGAEAPAAAAAALGSASADPTSADQASRDEADQADEAVGAGPHRPRRRAARAGSDRPTAAARRRARATGTATTKAVMAGVAPHAGSAAGATSGAKPGGLAGSPAATPAEPLLGVEPIVAAVGDGPVPAASTDPRARVQIARWTALSTVPVVPAVRRGLPRSRFARVGFEPSGLHRGLGGGGPQVSGEMYGSAPPSDRGATFGVATGRAAVPGTGPAPGDDSLPPAPSMTTPVEPPEPVEPVEPPEPLDPSVEAANQVVTTLASAMRCEPDAFAETAPMLASILADGGWSAPALATHLVDIIVGGVKVIGDKPLDGLSWRLQHLPRTSADCPCRSCRSWRSIMPAESGSTGGAGSVGGPPAAPPPLAEIERAAAAGAEQARLLARAQAS